ncbi:MAG TPA: helix-turn-helix transcriptional regulator [Thermoleophilia bacterium]|nr:helix-turn-helix transcriptional regulator [Thermoleophilia bacterium]
MKPMKTALRELMDERGMNETDLMAAAQVSPSTVNLYLAGKRGVRVNSQAMKTVQKLAGALRVEPEYFCEYRQARAEQLVRHGISQGIIDLEDVELLLTAHQERMAAGRASSE